MTAPAEEVLPGDLGTTEAIGRSLGAVATTLRVTPYTMTAVDRSCPRWLEATVHDEPKLAEPFLRGRVRDPLLKWLMEGHRDGGTPSLETLLAPRNLLPEEIFYLRKFASTYLSTYATRPGTVIDHGLTYPTEFQKRKLKVGGWVDLLLTDGDGQFELRQFELWGGALESDPEHSWEIALAILRLVTARVIQDTATLLVSHVDLNTGHETQTRLDLSKAIPTIGNLFDARIGELTARISSPIPQPGPTCSMCAFVDTCSHWNTDDTFVKLVRKPATFVAGLVKLTPSYLDTWIRCHRQFRANYLLNLPANSQGESAVAGLEVHRLLHLLHEKWGSCDTPRDIESLMGEFQNNNRFGLDGCVQRHREFCPGRDLEGEHEVTVARLYPGPPRPFMMTGRIDAIWTHDGMLDVRDYKTGRLFFDRTADDLSAKVQAWLVEPIAAREGLRIRVQHEYLAPEVEHQPETFEPEEEDLEEVGQMISRIAQEIYESGFEGTSDSNVCGWCGYRDPCPDAFAVLDDQITIAVTSPDDEPF
jgi:RecB family exonuclease